LTSFAACGGCASKLAAGELARALGVLPVASDARVLVDYRTSDDAGVYRLDGERAIVQTVDFFTPIVDDPYVYGQIAAANAMSDVYAMGGRPLTALAIAAFSKEVERDVINAIFSGGIAMLDQAGVALLGGHTVQDPEIKFGYAVTGHVNPERMWTNAGARPGDVILLTKPLGTGVVTTAIKFDRAPEALARQAVASMLTLNKTAAEVLQTLEAGAVHACTDVTGFGAASRYRSTRPESRCSTASSPSPPRTCPAAAGRTLSTLATARSSPPGSRRRSSSFSTIRRRRADCSWRSTRGSLKPPSGVCRMRGAVPGVSARWLRVGQPDLPSGKVSSTEARPTSSELRSRRAAEGFPLLSSLANGIN
jgi:selenide,water dikinase